MQFANGVISESFSVFLERKKVIAILLIAFVILGYLQTFMSSSTGFNVAYTFLMSILAISVHQIIINGSFDEKSITDLKFVFSYVSRVIAMTLLAVVPAIVAMIISFGAGKAIAVAIGIVVWVFSYVLLLGVLGTVLPALAVGSDKSWASAFHRGRSTAGYVLTRLIFLNGGLLFVLLAVFAVIVTVLRKNGIVMDGDSPLWLLLPTNLVMNLCTTFLAVMASTILSRAYLMAEGEGNAPSTKARMDRHKNLGKAQVGTGRATPAVTRTGPLFGTRR